MKKSKIILLVIVIILGIVGCFALLQFNQDNIENNTIANSEIQNNTENETIITSDDKTDVNSYKIKMTIGDKVIEGTLDSSITSQEFVKTLPRVMTMTNYSDREIYGNIGKNLTTENTSSSIENGDILYFVERNYFALFYNIDANPNVSSSYLKIGEITSDLSVFSEIENNVEMEIEIVD